MPAETNGSFIPLQTANAYIRKFIDDYFATGRAPVKSMIVDAGLLRDYLNDNMNITHVKFALGARTVDDKEVLTLVIAGYDDNGNYVLAPGNEVMDNVTPCPPSCPLTGNSANDYIITNDNGTEG